MTTAPTSAAIVICAYTMDRWDDVLAAVDSAKNQRHQADEIIIVVDHEPELLNRLSATLTGVTVVRNQREQGLSGARNTAVEMTSSAVLAFLDDDAAADPDWLAMLLKPYTDDSVAGVGGLTLPRWDTARPTWFPPEFDWTIGCTFVGRDPGPVRNLLGGNASFRREVFDLAGGFPEHMGRNSADQRPLGAEETEFCIRASQRRPGWRFIYEPTAVITHRVPAGRAKFSYFRTRCYAEGLSKAALVRSLGASDGLSAERGYVARTLTRGVLRGFGEALHADPSGLRRSAAIVLGLIFTGWGYVYGSMQGGFLGSIRRGR